MPTFSVLCLLSLAQKVPDIYWCISKSEVAVAVDYSGTYLRFGGMFGIYKAVQIRRLQDCTVKETIWHGVDAISLISDKHEWVFPVGEQDLPNFRRALQDALM
jgi:hypothetical protein